MKNPRKWSVEIVSRAGGEFMNTLELKGIGNAVRFTNGICIVNTTPHPVAIQDVNGDVVMVPTSVLVNAKAEENQVSNIFVETVFTGTPDGEEIIKNIKDAYKATACTDTLIIIGSIIAAQAYPGQVVAMCPVTGFERVAPSEKRMRCDKFTIFSEKEIKYA